MRARCLFLFFLLAAGALWANQQYWTTLENESGGTASSLTVQVDQAVQNPFAESTPVWGNDPDGSFLTAAGGGSSTLSFSNWSPGGEVPEWQAGYPEGTPGARNYWVDVGWTDTNAYDEPVHVLSYQWNGGQQILHPLQFLATGIPGSLGLDVDLYNPSSVDVAYSGLECWTGAGSTAVGQAPGIPCLLSANFASGVIGAGDTLRIAQFVPDGVTYLMALDETNHRTVVAGGNANAVPGPVPEPGTVALTGVGALLVIVVAHRRRGRT